MANGAFGGGAGTEAIPYLVEDEKDFLAIQSVSLSTPFFLQSRDLDFSNVPFTRITKSLGGYDGGSFSIKGISSRYDLTGSSFSIGRVFDRVNSLRNLYLENIDIVISHTGSLASANCFSSILALSCTSVYNVHGKNCSLYSYIESTNNNSQESGFLGSVSNLSTSSFDGDIHAILSRGGKVAGLACHAARVSDCYSSGSVYMEINRAGYFAAIYLGGLVATCGSAIDCYSSSTVNFSILTANKSAYTTALACLVGTASTEVSNCFYLGKGMVNRRFTNGYGTGFDYYDICGTPSSTITDSYCIDTAILKGE